MSDKLARACVIQRAASHEPYEWNVTVQSWGGGVHYDVIGNARPPSQLVGVRPTLTIRVYDRTSLLLDSDDLRAIANELDRWYGSDEYHAHEAEKKAKFEAERLAYDEGERR